MWYLYNRSTDCYSTEKTLNGVNAKLGLGWEEVDREEFMEARRRGWVEYEPGKLQPPAPAQPAADGEFVSGKLETVTSDSGVTSLCLYCKTSDNTPRMLVEASAVSAHTLPLQQEIAALKAENARLAAALRPFANSYHVYRDQYEGEYGDMLNYATDHFDGESLEVNCKAAYDALQATEPDA